MKMLLHCPSVLRYVPARTSGLGSSWVHHGTALHSTSDKLRSKRRKGDLSLHAGKYSDSGRIPELHHVSGSNVSKLVQLSLDKNDVDQDLWYVLELCTNEELEEVYGILHGISPLSPVVKSIVADSEPAAIGLRGRPAIMRRIEARFRFLAADAVATLRGKRPSYREALLSVCYNLEIKCPSTLATQDLETEIFVHMMEKHADAISALQPSGSDPSAFQEGDGMAFIRAAQVRGLGWVERMAAPLKLGGKELLPTLIKLGSAVTVDNVRGVALQRLYTQLAAQTVRYDAALSLLCRGGAKGLAASLQRHTAVKVAQRGVTSAAARYSAVRGAMAMLGPIMWAWLGADLALKAVGTDYGRLVRAIFALAQIRLLRTNGFTAPA